MGSQEWIMGMMVGRKSPEAAWEMMADMTPIMTEKLGPDGMRTMMGEMMPKMMEQMGPEGMSGMMGEMMPKMMDSCFGAMDGERRVFMLSHYRGMLDSMETKYVTSDG